MWSQLWGNIYDLVEPYQGVANLDVTGALASRITTRSAWCKLAEEFFTSLSLPELPETFWERSMLTKPRDRDVVCHASAWPMDGQDDVRIKMCIQPNEEDLTTIYHELGHIYYFLAQKDQPPLFQSGAHDGFHEAIGDTITLAMTPEYMQSIGLVSDFERDERATINQQMKMALDKIAFLPFGKLVDQWRWDVFAGQDGARRLQQELVGAAHPLPGHCAAGGAQRGQLRSGRQVPRAGQRALHALFSFAHHAVPVLQGHVRACWP